ncbi:MAG: hypothetical protein ABSH12_00520 [Endomicrobiales bacterium]|jgi:hypothetical protein
MKYILKTGAARIARSMCERSSPYIWLFIVVVAVYGRTLASSFVWFDDNWLILAHPAFLSDPRNAIQLFHESVYHGIASHFYRPLFNLTLMVDASIAGTAPLIYHCSSVLYHLLACVLLFTLFDRVGIDRRVCLGSTLLFAVHPALVSAVAWIPGRNDVLLCVWVLAAALSLISYLDKPSAARAVLQGVLFAAALFTKETAVFFIIIGMMYARYVRIQRPTVRTMLMLVLTWIIPVALWMYARSCAAGLLSVTGRGTGDGTNGIIHIIMGLLWYAGRILYPFPQVLYPRPEVVGIIIGTVICIAWAVLLVTRRAAPGHRLAWLGGAWFLVFTVPSMVLGAYSFEHRLYVPLCGALLSVASMVSLEKIRTQGVAILGAATVVCCASVSFVRSTVYADRISYWSASVAQRPRAAPAHLRMAEAWSSVGSLTSARTEAQQALDLDPTLIAARFLRGNIELTTGEFEKAVADFEAVLRVHPLDADTLRLLERARQLSSSRHTVTVL